MSVAHVLHNIAIHKNFHLRELRYNEHNRRHYVNLQTSSIGFKNIQINFNVEIFYQAMQNYDYSF